MSISKEQLIKALPSELREKARECRTADELVKLGNGKTLSLNDDALEEVVGGAICSKTYSDPTPKSSKKNRVGDACPKRTGGMPHVVTLDSVESGYMVLKCTYCEKRFYTIIT